MTAHQILIIPIEHLRPGMYVCNVFNGRDVLLYSANTLIKDNSQIDALRRQGVSKIGINLQKGAAAGTPVLHGQPKRGAVIMQAPKTDPETNTEFDEGMVKRGAAARIQALDALHQIMNSARAGRLFSIGTIAESVEPIIESMLEDPDVMLNLCNLRNHCDQTYVHSVNVAVLMIGFAIARGHPRERVREAGIGGLLHDIGKTGLPGYLLRKQGSCTRQEHELLKRHPEIGLEIMERNGIRLSRSVLNVIGQHHERLSGGGYPSGLTGSSIDENAFICAIADRYDTLTTQGCSHRSSLPQEALALIFQGADDEYPRNLVEHFTKLLGIYPVGSFVKLENGEMGVVIKNNRNALLAPVVKVLFDRAGVKLETPHITDLSDAGDRYSGHFGRILNSLDPHTFNVQIEGCFMPGYR